MDSVAGLLQENQRLKIELAVERRGREEAERERRALEKKTQLQDLRIAELLSQLYRRGSEKLSADERIQMRLFDEAEREQTPREATEDKAGIVVPEHTRARPRRRPLPPELPRVDVVIDIPEADKRCGCGQELVKIGEEVSEKLDLIPPKVQVIRTVRPKYACHHCEGSGDEERAAVRCAPMPRTIIDKGIATPGLLAWVVTAKFADALPLYRQERQFARIGVDLPRQTLADWMIRAAEAVSPILEILRDRVRAGPLLQVDETTVQVLEEEGRKNTTQSYMWVHWGGPPTQRVILYHYAPSRATEVAVRLIGDYRGYVQTDGYEVYDRACDRTGIVHVGCWAHARRMFVEAKKVGGKSGSADEALALITKLYALEADRAVLEEPIAFAEHRRDLVQPILQKLRGWLDRKRDQTPPSSAVGKAVAYTLGQWPKLIRYLEDAAIGPDTNPCERAIRPFVVGRKNWLFSGSPRGAAASAALYGLIETARANGLEPYAYLRRLFEALPTATTTEQLAALVPFAPVKH